MTITDAITTCFRKALTFSGRASRAEFWWFVLFLTLGVFYSIITNSIENGPKSLYLQYRGSDGTLGSLVPIGQYYTFGWFGDVFSLVCLLPWLAVTWRRMHDISKPGYLPFITLLSWAVFVWIVLVAYINIPAIAEIINANSNAIADSKGGTVSINFYFILAVALTLSLAIITNTYWLTKRSTPSSNKYGPNPHEVSP